MTARFCRTTSGEGEAVRAWRAQGQARPTCGPTASLLVDEYQNFTPTVLRELLAACREIAQDRLLLETSSGPVEADIVVAGVGVTPNVELAEEAGIGTSLPRTIPNLGLSEPITVSR